MDNFFLQPSVLFCLTGIVACLIYVFRPHTFTIPSFPKRKQDDPFAEATQMAAARHEYLRIEHAAMQTWETACNCPPPQLTYCQQVGAADYRCHHASLPTTNTHTAFDQSWRDQHPTIYH